MDKPERVLLVEDSIASSTAVKIILKKLGHEVDHAKTGSEAVLMASSNDYELILMDIGLPDMTGFEVTEKIRQLDHPTRSCVQIIALTSHIDMQEKCLDSGMQGLIPKPLLENQMEKVLSDDSKSFEGYKFQPKEVPKETPKENERELIHAVVRDLKLKRHELISNHEARDSHALRRALHHIKGGACYIKRPALLNSLNDLHNAVKDDFQNKERLDLMLSRLLNVIDSFCYENKKVDEDIKMH